ncbi:hypothetical protein [Veillonella sp.]|uniref:hypothetical protein n=1 Tax=Veillonella sp. TaxID=1926307 RepID=UPI002055F3DC|nr:hypothetical protein [Veillonella sp.]MDU4573461.1 hypothetical protein [Veillonella sp.]DAE53117.1 MAG TPA: hypothetical protein [Caudoviricetes sp.]DAY21914.1 MAG TPA: hypothetical protein [Caudoviricetes sp.]
MNAKRLTIIFLIFIVVCISVIFLLRPSPSIEFKNEVVLGQTTTQVVLEDWTILSATGGYDSKITLDNGKSADAKWQIVEDVPPSYRLDMFPHSFYHHHIFIAPVQPGVAKVMTELKPTVTYYLGGQEKQINIK